LQDAAAATRKAKHTRYLSTTRTINHTYPRYTCTDTRTRVRACGFCIHAFCARCKRVHSIKLTKLESSPKTTTIASASDSKSPSDCVRKDPFVRFFWSRRPGERINQSSRRRECGGQSRRPPAAPTGGGARASKVSDGLGHELVADALLQQQQKAATKTTTMTATSAIDR
jgi:hypothetical protein